MREEHKRWKALRRDVERIVRTLKGETGTKFEHVDELIQDCLVHVYKNLPKFEGKNGCQEFSFLYQLCRNHLINYHIFHTRGKRDHRQKINAGLHPVNFTGLYAKEDSDEMSYYAAPCENSPEDILQSEQLAQAIAGKYESDESFRKYLDWAWGSGQNVVDINSQIAISAFDGLLEVA